MSENSNQSLQQSTKSLLLLPIPIDGKHKNTTLSFTCIKYTLTHELETHVLFI